MADSQSRYGIMDELNNRKLKAKESLSKIEAETDETLWQNEKKIAETEQQIKDKESSYVMDFKRQQREIQIRIRMLKEEYQRRITKEETTLKELEKNYEKDFQDWKKQKQEELKSTKKGLERYKAVQEAKITEKKEIIAEIEKSIDDLKEMSKEQAKA